MRTLLKRPSVLEGCALSDATLRRRINDGLFPPPVSIGGRGVAWPSNEVESVRSAFIAGKSNDEIKLLVKVLIEKRQQGVV